MAGCACFVGIALSLVGPKASNAFASDPWADRVISFSAGTGGSDGYHLASSALGSPTRFTGASFGFPSAVTPFSPPFEPGDIVSLGTGGQITVAFDEPVTNDAANPFGVDLLIFGNSFYYDADWPSGLVGGFAGEGGVIEVSADGRAWHTIPLLAADAGFPTLGYLDLATPYSDTPGSIDSDFTRPVDPSFDASGKTFAEIVAAYNGAGGGLGVDLSSVGLDSISFVRVSNPSGAGGTPEIDAFVDVSPIPAPGLLTLVAVGLLGSARATRICPEPRAVRRSGSSGVRA
ncbi:MAG: hypothetical protein IT434_00370 [Phycisphaerales bacterium]|jgi:hypothetical protein|nr:hypothetical protein [Phycisphaerales bacterium]